MNGERDNLPTGGTDDAQSPISLDDAAGIDFYDPGEDNEEAETEQQSEIGPDEAEDGQESEESEAADAEDDETAEDDGQAEGDEPEAAEIKDDVVVTLQSGEKLPLNELKSGYMRQADYSRKTQELSNQRRELEALSSTVNNAVNAIAAHLTKSMPQPPDPNLAVTNPAEYVRKKAIHDQAMAQIAAVVQQAQAPKQAANTLTEQQHRELIASETAKLHEAFPQTATPEGRKKFFDEAASAARELGYSDDEVGQVTDHRMFKLAHFARIGMHAVAAKAKAAKKVANVPPVAPARRQQAKGQAQRRSNREAMARLSKTGSIEDALLVDFD